MDMITHIRIFLLSISTLFAFAGVLVVMDKTSPPKVVRSVRMEKYEKDECKMITGHFSGTSSGEGWICTKIVETAPDQSPSST